MAKSNGTTRAGNSRNPRGLVTNGGGGNTTPQSLADEWGDGKRPQREISNDVEKLFSQAVDGQDLKVSGFKQTKSGMNKRYELKVSDDVSLEVNGQQGEGYVVSARVGIFHADLSDNYYTTVASAKAAAIKGIKKKGRNWSFS